jgi:hypothetical protein
MKVQPDFDIKDFKIIPDRRAFRVDDTYEYKHQDCYTVKRREGALFLKYWIEINSFKTYEEAVNQIEFLTNDKWERID